MIDIPAWLISYLVFDFEPTQKENFWKVIIVIDAQGRWYDVSSVNNVPPNGEFLFDDEDINKDRPYYVVRRRRSMFSKIIDAFALMKVWGVMRESVRSRCGWDEKKERLVKSGLEKN